MVVLPTCCLVAATKIGRDFALSELMLVDVVLSPRTMADVWAFDEPRWKSRTGIFDSMVILLADGSKYAYFW